MLKTITKLIVPDISIDLGTANIVVSSKSKGIIINEPSVVAIQKNKKGEKKILSVGIEAKKMLGKTPKNISAIRPMRDGVIADFDTTEIMINYFIQKAYSKNFFFKPTVVICIPYGVTAVEKNAVKESALAAGAKKVYLIEEPLAAAIGAGIPVTAPEGHVVVDIGAGTTEIGLTSLGGLVLCHASKVAGDTLDTNVRKYIKQKYNIHIGEGVAEEIKFEVGTAIKLEDNISMKVKGRDNLGYLRTIDFSSDEYVEAIKESLYEIVKEIKKLLEKMPPDLASDVIDNGIVLTGGGAMLREIDKYFMQYINLPVRVCDEPLLAVSRGTQEVLKDSKLLQLIKE